MPSIPGSMTTTHSCGRGLARKKGKLLSSMKLRPHLFRFIAETGRFERGGMRGGRRMMADGAQTGQEDESSM